MLVLTVLLTALALTETMHQIELRVHLPSGARAGGEGDAKPSPQQRTLTTAERAKVAAAEALLAEADAAELAALHETSPIKGLHAKSLRLYERVLSDGPPEAAGPGMGAYHAARLGAGQAAANAANEMLEDGDATGALAAYSKAAVHLSSKDVGHAGQLEQVRVLSMIVKASRDADASGAALKEKSAAARHALKKVLEQTGQHSVKHRAKVMGMLKPGALEKILPFTARHDDL